MIFKVAKSQIEGRLSMPASKSHTIRAVYIASLAQGTSLIRNPLRSADTASAVNVCTHLGAEIRELSPDFEVKGFGSEPSSSDSVVDVGNSGTSLRIGVSAAALAQGMTEFTGDEQIQRRPLQPLLDALNSLGAEAVSVHDNGMAPVKIKGPMKGGHASIDAFTSQFLSSLLISCPLASEDTEITVLNLNEKPYIDMTLWWLQKQNINFSCDQEYTSFSIPGSQSYSPFDLEIPADFSSATFFIVLAAVSGGTVVFENLDLGDPQGDKKVLAVVEEMGALVAEENGTVCVQGGELEGIEVDINDIPDALPALAVAGCFAEGETRLVNAPQVRLKETDRIKVMHEELSLMGADIEELEHGLIIRKSNLQGTSVHGHDDHRVVMALAVAGLNAEGETQIDTAEAVDITFPGFAECVEACGGKITVQ